MHINGWRRIVFIDLETHIQERCVGSRENNVAVTCDEMGVQIRIIVILHNLYIRR